MITNSGSAKVYSSDNKDEEGVGEGIDGKVPEVPKDSSWRNFPANGALKDFDKDGDGLVTKGELETYISTHLGVKQEKEFFKKSVKVLSLLLLFFSALIVGMGFVAIEVTKEVRVDDDDSTNTLRGGTDNEVVVTEQPRYYTTIGDIQNLPQVALNGLSQLSFTTTNGVLHNYAVEGTMLDALSKTVLVYFRPGKELKITNGTFVFREKNLFTDEVTETNVVFDDAEGGQRRLQAMETFGDNDLHERCTITEGVCYHTYEEILALSGAADGRRLDTEESQVTYGEINVDTSILRKDSTAGLVRASSFLEGILGLNLTATLVGTTTISFVMKERCTNYPDLVAACQSQPVPDTMLVDDDSVYNAILEAHRPYPGLYPVDGKWSFADSVEYAKDVYSIRLKIRYSHDPLHADRLHVMLMSRDDPNTVVTYDEVTTTSDPYDSDHYFVTPQVYLTNYKVVTDVEDVDGADNIVGDSRRHLSVSERADRAFGQFVKRKAAGFPGIKISESLWNLDTVPLENESHDDFLARRLDDENITDLDIVEFEADTTTSNVYGLAEPNASYYNVTVDYNASSLYNLDLYYNGTNGSTAILIPVVADPVEGEMDEDGNEYDDVSTAEEPVVVFSAPLIETEEGLIQWPSLTDIVDVDDFLSVEIVHRGDLDMYLLDNETVTNGTDRRSLSSKDNKGVVVMSPGDEGNSRRMLVVSYGGEEGLDTQFMKHLANLDKALAELQESIEDMTAENEGALVMVGDEDDSHRRLASLPYSKKYSTKFPRFFSADRTMVVRTVTTNKMPSSYAKKFVPDAVLNRIFKAGAWEYAMSTLVDRMNDDCADYNTDIAIVLKLLDNIVTAQRVAYNVAQQSIIALEKQYLEKTENTLSLWENIYSSFKPMSGLLKKVPGVGPLLNIFWLTFSSTTTKVVTPINTKLEVIILQKNKAQMLDNLRTFVTRNEQLGLQLFNTMDALKLTRWVLLADGMCPAHFGSTTVPVCSALHTTFTPLISSLETMNDQLEEVGDTFNEVFDPVLDAVSSLQQSSVWKATASMISSTRAALGVLSDFLSIKLKVCIPWLMYRTKRVCQNIRYPTGTKWCKKKIKIGGFKKKIKYPCGTNYAYKSVCTNIKTPYVGSQCASFTIAQIVLGAMSVMSPLQTALTLGMEAMAKALSLSFPAIPLPGMPSVAQLKKFELNLEYFELETFDEMDAVLETMLDAMSNLPTGVIDCVE